MFESNKNNGKENKAHKNGRKSQQLRLAVAVLKQGALTREVTCEGGIEVSERAAYPDIRGGAILSEGIDGAKDTVNKAVTVPFPSYRRNWHLAFSAFCLSFPGA